MMLMLLDNPDGYVMCLNTKSNIFEIPENVKLFALALELISAVWMFKVCIYFQFYLQLDSN